VRDGETIYFAIAPPAAALGGGSGPVLRTYGLLAPPKRLMRGLKQVRWGAGTGRVNGGLDWWAQAGCWLLGWVVVVVVVVSLGACHGLSCLPSYSNHTKHTQSRTDQPTNR
jgi:hypothetical protein